MGARPLLCRHTPGGGGGEANSNWNGSGMTGTGSTGRVHADMVEAEAIAVDVTDAAVDVSHGSQIGIGGLCGVCGHAPHLPFARTSCSARILQRFSWRHV